MIKKAFNGFLMSSIWRSQRLMNRIWWRELTTRKTISARKNFTTEIHTLFYTDDPLNHESYKIDYESNFRKSLCVKNAKLNPKTGVVWVNDRLLVESSVWDVKDLKKWEPNPKIFQSLSGEFKSLPDNSYFHFLIEDLPRYIEIHRWNQTSKTISGSRSRYVIDTLDFLTPSNYLVLSSPVRLEKLFVSEKINGKLFSRHDLSLLSDTFSQLLTKTEEKKIFISRRDSIGEKYNSRGLRYKDQVEYIFKQYQFQIVFMEDLSFLEQIKLASSSSVIAGFHGAGLSNIIWAAEGSTVIEVTNSRMTHHFKYISEICAHKYLRFSVQNSLSDLVSSLDKI